MNTLKALVTYGSFVVAGAVVALNGIAPLTKTMKDDKLRDFLVFLHDKILSVLLPFIMAVRIEDEKDGN